MIAALALALSVDATDLDAPNAAIGTCDSKVVTRIMGDERTRHGAFVLDAFREQEAIVAARLAVAERRRKAMVPTPAKPVARANDAEAAIGMDAQAIVDRQQALDDQRTLDRLRQDAVTYFRQIYLYQCQGKGGA